MAHGLYHNDDPSLVRRAASSSRCAFYTSPKLDESVNYDNITFTWDTNCFGSNPKLIDVYLLEPGNKEPQIFLWKHIPFESGSFIANPMPEWRNGNKTTTTRMQVAVTGAGEPLFLSPIAAGPVFTAKYNQTASLASTAEHATFTSSHWLNMQSWGGRNHMSKGSIIAAVLIPILIAIGVIAAYITYSRRRGEFKRRQWAENVDKRMSTISAEWQSMSAAGAQAAARNSYVSSNRLSMLGGPVRGSQMVETGSGRGASLYDRFNANAVSKTSFASEDLSQLGPRARALSAAAAEGRPLSSLIHEKDLTSPPLPEAQPRGRTTSNANSAERSRSAVRQANRISSNNPYASAIRRSAAASNEGGLAAFPAAIPRPRPVDASKGARAASRVSFAEALASTEHRGRDGRHLTAAYAHDPRNRSNSRLRGSAAQSGAYDMDLSGDTYPALALMRTKSLEYEDVHHGESPLTPTTHFLPNSRAGLFPRNHLFQNGIDGQTPDEMMRAYAAMSRERAGANGNENGVGFSSLVGTVKKFGMGLWRK